MASALDTARAGIEARITASATLDTYFRTRQKYDWKDVAVKWPGMDFEPPDSGPWFSVAILWGEGTGETAGSGGANTVPGVLVFGLFGELGDGMGDLYDLADVLRDLFDRATVGSVEFLAAGGVVAGVRTAAPGMAQAGEESAGRWQQVTVSVPFILEETS